MYDTKKLVNITNKVRLTKEARKQASTILKAAHKRNADAADIYELATILTKYNQNRHELLNRFEITKEVDNLLKLIYS